MTATIHRLLMTLGAVASGLGATWQLSEVQILGIPPEVGAICALIASISVLLANAIRANFPNGH